MPNPALLPHLPRLVFGGAYAKDATSARTKPRELRSEALYRNGNPFWGFLRAPAPPRDPIFPDASSQDFAASGRAKTLRIVDVRDRSCICCNSLQQISQLK